MEDAAEGVARDYALAATNWSAATYRAAHRRQQRLAGIALRRALQRTRPTRTQVLQLAHDRESRLGVVTAVHSGSRAEDEDADTANVLVDVNEIHFDQERRTRLGATYSVALRRTGDRWLVSRFGVRKVQP